MLTRRGFLWAFGAAAAGAALSVSDEFDPELLLWRPGAKKIFLPSTTILEPVVEPRWLGVIRPVGPPSLPRFTLEVAGKGVFHFDDQEGFLGGVELAGGDIQNVMVQRTVSREDAERLFGVKADEIPFRRTDRRDNLGHAAIFEKIVTVVGYDPNDVYVDARAGRASLAAASATLAALKKQEG